VPYAEHTPARRVRSRASLSRAGPARAFCRISSAAGMSFAGRSTPARAAGRGPQCERTLCGPSDPRVGRVESHLLPPGPKPDECGSGIPLGVSPFLVALGTMLVMDRLVLAFVFGSIEGGDLSFFPIEADSHLVKPWEKSTFYDVVPIAGDVWLANTRLRSAG